MDAKTFEDALLASIDSITIQGSELHTVLSRLDSEIAAQLGSQSADIDRIQKKVRAAVTKRVKTQAGLLGPVVNTIETAAVSGVAENTIRANDTVSRLQDRPLGPLPQTQNQTRPIGISQTANPTAPNQSGTSPPPTGNTFVPSLASGGGSHSPSQIPSGSQGLIPQTGYFDPQYAIAHGIQPQTVIYPPGIGEVPVVGPFQTELLSASASPTYPPTYPASDIAVPFTEDRPCGHDEVLGGGNEGWYCPPSMVPVIASSMPTPLPLPTPSPTPIVQPDPHITPLPLPPSAPVGSLAVAGSDEVAPLAAPLPSGHCCPLPGDIFDRPTEFFGPLTTQGYRDAAFAALGLTHMVGVKSANEFNARSITWLSSIHSQPLTPLQ